jgi:hypothetical protein
MVQLAGIRMGDEKREDVMEKVQGLADALEVVRRQGARVIFATMAGSRLYGTHRPDSDTDVRGVALEPVDSLIGLDAPWEQYERHDPDLVVYGMRKFVRLAAANNPNILDMLFAPEEAWLQLSYYWSKLYELRHDLLHQNIRKTYVGYAVSQLKRIETHRRWAGGPPPPVGTRDRASYDEYVRTRNPARYETEQRSGYDCYTDTTEFLTENGWCRYDWIETGTKLATINPITHNVEFQDFTDRVSKSYSGVLYQFQNRQTNCMVTPNHRMYVSNAHRSMVNNFSMEYVADRAKWRFTPMESLFSERRSHYHVLAHGSQCNTDFDIPIPLSSCVCNGDTALRIMGLYLSEGCIGHRGSKFEGRSIRISQKKDNPVDGYITTYLSHIPFSRYEYERHNHVKSMTEVVWDLSDHAVAQWLQSWCGELSGKKSLPPWTMFLSHRQAWVLLGAMLAGDGTDRGEKRSWIYYTTSRRLADGIQAMCVCCGITSQIWGPYAMTGSDTKMYQVYVRKPEDDAMFITARRANITSHIVDNARIVCFTVPNETLVTRLNGKVSLHGNTKHGAHLVRLLLQGRAILRDGDFSPRLEGADLDKVLTVLHGRMAYDGLIAWSTRVMGDIDVMESNLPKEPRMDRVREAVRAMTLAHVR